MHLNFWVNIEPADGILLLGARTSAGTVTTKFEFYTESALWQQMVWFPSAPGHLQSKECPMSNHTILLHLLISLITNGYSLFSWIKQINEVKFDA